MLERKSLTSHILYSQVSEEFVFVAFSLLSAISLAFAVHSLSFFPSHVSGKILMAAAYQDIPPGQTPKVELSHIRENKFLS